MHVNLDDEIVNQMLIEADAAYQHVIDWGNKWSSIMAGIDTHTNERQRAIIINHIDQLLASVRDAGGVE